MELNPFWQRGGLFSAQNSEKSNKIHKKRIKIQPRRILLWKR
jgi:hypothetical protein